MTEYVVCFSGMFFFFLMKNKTEKQKFLADGIVECGVIANKWVSSQTISKGGGKG